MRRLLLRGLAVLLLTGGFVPMGGGTSWACSCASPTATESDEWSAVAAREAQIYVGVVVAEQPPAHINGERSYTLQVSDSLKGGAIGTRTVTTAGNGAMCGVLLDPARPVLVYGSRLGLCGNGGTQTRVAERATIVEQALHRPSTTYVTAAGDTVSSVARAQLRAQLGTEPSASHVDVATRTLLEANRKRLGPRPGALRPGTRLVVPRLT